MDTDAGFEVESSLFATGAIVVAGVDDVGYGAICGPLVFGAVAVRPSTPLLSGLRDSKLLSAARREHLAAQIPKWAAAHALGVVHAGEIDAIGVKAALREAVRRALTELETDLGQTPETVILDGSVNLAGRGYRVTTMPKADVRCATVAAASILAKVWRDAYMTDLDQRLPGYGLAGHKGYGTAVHYRAIDELGFSEEHRRSFKRKHQ